MYILSTQYVETLISGTHSAKTVVIPFALIWSPIKGQANREVIKIYKEVGHSFHYSGALLTPRLHK